MSDLVTIGGGCYWCLEAFFQRVVGIERVVSGFSGGTLVNPTSQKVYAGNSGHAEVIQITFDNSVISYEEILEIFFVMHDPTTLNQQGNDIGTEYRSIILYDGDEQKTIAKRMIDEFAAPLYPNKIVTELVPLKVFWPAGDEDQNFYNDNPNSGYCLFVISPKIKKLRQSFVHKLK